MESKVLQSVTLKEGAILAALRMYLDSLGYKCQSVTIGRYESASGIHYYANAACVMNIVPVLIDAERRVAPPEGVVDGKL